MNKLFIIALLLVSTMLYSVESLLIDFSMITDENTLLDYSEYLPGPDSKISLGLDNWQVFLNDSSSTIERQRASLTKTAESKKFGNVLGVKIDFPTWNNNSYAEIFPPFIIPAYNDGTDFEGFGVVNNVEAIQNISINVYSNNYPFALILMLEDQDYKRIEVNMGSLVFEGWRTLVWNNTGYISDVSKRKLESKPTYPNSATFLKFIGFKILRDGNVSGGESTIYFKDVSLVHDKSTLLEESDIDDEAVWGIISEREFEINTTNLRKLAERMDLYGNEQIRMDVSEPETTE